jgi:hypothetical protein
MLLSLARRLMAVSRRAIFVVAVWPASIAMVGLLARLDFMMRPTAMPSTSTS